MSAARRTDGRAQARKTLSSPYARPQQTSGWSLRKFLEPIRRRVFGQPVENGDQGFRGHQLPRSPSPEEANTHDEGPYLQRSNTLDGEGSEPPRTPSASTSPKRPVPTEGPSPTETLENVIEFLTDAAGTTLKREEAQWLTSLISKSATGERVVSQSLMQSVGRPLSAIEVEGMISLLRKLMDREKSEPFRFQSATPSRGVSPSGPSSSSSTPRKTLTRNPNGVYRWEGAGSARQTTRRNRYSSPAFGTQQLTPEKRGDGDKKRRKVDDGPAASSSNDFTNVTKLPFPISSPQTPRTNGAAVPKVVIPAASPSKLRTPTVLKPTTPSHPSPLRQAWSGSPSSPQEDLSHSDQSRTTPPPKQSNAANLVSELIKEVTPSKKPDLSNPYQTASPLNKIGPPRRSTRRSRATGKPNAPVNGKEPEKKQAPMEEPVKTIPAQAIIEATLPKGSKRSRPPANLERSSSPEASGSFSSLPPAKFPSIEEEVSDDRASKKAKSTSVTTSSTPIQGSEEKDVEMDTSGSADKPTTGSLSGSQSAPSVPSTNGFPTFNSLKSTTAPARPSNLRYSYQPPTNSVPSSPASGSTQKLLETEAPPPPTISSTFSNLPEVGPTASTSKLSSTPSSSKMDEDTPIIDDPKAHALKMDSKSIPTFTFIFTSKPNMAHSKEREAAKSKYLATLPVFDFSRSALASDKRPQNAALGSPWTCSVCMSKNPSDAKEKCTICEAPRAGIKQSAPALKAFDWSAAGMKAPASTSGSGDWTCNVCMLTSPASATEKCTVCDAPRSDTKKSAPAVSAFDWSAAGIKAPAAASGSEWTCSTCMLSNPDSEKEKCTVCDAERPGASTPQPTSSFAAPSALVVKGFDWSAAGIKAPTAASAGWTCSTCMLSNPASATTKCTICDAPR